MKKLIILFLLIISNLVFGQLEKQSKSNTRKSIKVILDTLKIHNTRIGFGKKGIILSKDKGYMGTYHGDNIRKVIIRTRYNFNYSIIDTNKFRVSLNLLLNKDCTKSHSRYSNLTTYEKSTYTRGVLISCGLENIFYYNKDTMEFLILENRRKYHH